jgi:hypothetical protein
MITKVLQFISTYKIVGIIPLDLVAHFLVGMVWTIIGLKKDLSFKVVCTGLFLIALLKEVYDYSFVYVTHWTEYASDFAITLLYIVVLFFVRKLKKNLDKSVSEERWNLYEKK